MARKRKRGGYNRTRGKTRRRVRVRGYSRTAPVARGAKHRRKRSRGPQLAWGRR